MNRKSLTKNVLGSTAGLSTLTKARFGAGMLLQHDDLNALSSYTQDLNRLMFRTLFGCGVMCGLVVSVDAPKCGKLTVRVGKGVALDACGDPIAVNDRQAIVIDTECSPEFPTTLWVVLCAKYKCCAPRTSMCAGDGDDDAPSVSTRERYGFDIRIVRDQPECACSCDGDDELQDYTSCGCANPKASCYSAHYGGRCDDGCGSSGGAGGGCGSGCGGDCGCDCLVLARLDNKSGKESGDWEVSHNVRRFIRPVLIEDPQARLEYDARAQKEEAAVAQETEVAALVEEAQAAKVAAVAVPDVAVPPDAMPGAIAKPKPAKAAQAAKGG
jgi:hypothetical protein